MRFTQPTGETHYAIHEVHYENDKPVGYTENPAVVLWEEEGTSAPLLILGKMMACLDKEILTEQDFNKS
jgi:hypothetical protein